MNSNSKFLGALVVIALVVGGYYVMTMPDTRTASQKVGDAIHDKDVRQLESRTPGEKLGDKIKDNTSAEHSND